MEDQARGARRIYSEELLGRAQIRGSVAKNILTTFYSGNKSALATISCVISEFLQQSRVLVTSQSHI
jgi:hypothetical protein